jgi:single-stranded DNA-binding protein
MTAKAADTIGTGWLVAITGRLEHQTWETTEGQKRSKHRIVASSVEFLAPPRGYTDDAADVQNDDIPF